jgi:hypothetical protein
MSYDNITVGMQVKRILAGSIPMDLLVSEVTDTRIICGPYEFDKKTGAEIDEDLGWGPETGHTGSYLKGVA